MEALESGVSQLYMKVKMNQYYLNEKKLTYVTDGARSLVHQSNIQDFLINKFKNKHGFIPQITLATDANYIDICEYLQRALEKIGLKIKVDVMTPALLKQSRSSGKLEMFRASWIADYPDAENYLSLFYSKNFSPNGPNYTHYQNEEFDALYQNSFEINNLQLSKENYKISL